MRKQRLFLFKVLIIASPFLLIAALYMITDPFRVLYTYHFDNYYDWQPWELNRDMVSFKNLKERLDKNDLPDAYIFGNSRSLVYRSDIWESVLNDHSRPYHFDASAESIWGIWQKVKYLDGKNIRIKDALLICDSTVFARTNNDRNIVYIKYPALSGESIFTYQATFFKAYFTDLFFAKQIDYLLSGKINSYTSSVFTIEPGNIRTTVYGNDHYYRKYDSMLKKDSTAYYAYMAHVFYSRPAQQLYSGPVLKEKQKTLLKEIKLIFDKNSTRYKIVISPLYGQRKLNRTDIICLDSIFGANTVYDYSGKNDITEYRSNYYETSHYKPHIANKILSEIYTQ